jgi:hypothetical protein
MTSRKHMHGKRGSSLWTQCIEKLKKQLEEADKLASLPAPPEGDDAAAAEHATVHAYTRCYNEETLACKRQVLCAVLCLQNQAKLAAIDVPGLKVELAEVEEDDDLSEKSMVDLYGRMSWEGWRSHGVQNADADACWVLQSVCASNFNPIYVITVRSFAACRKCFI